MPNEVLNTKHPGTESIKAIREWSKAKFASKQDGGSASFIIRLSFSPDLIDQTWVLAGGTERYTGTVKATPDDVKVIGIDDNSEAIRYTLTTQTISGEEITRIIQLKKTGNYYPFGLYSMRISNIDIVPWSSGTDEQITAIINALDSDFLTIEDINWKVGDIRTVTIGAMEAVDASETHAEQQITRVLGHIGAPNGIRRVDGGDIHFIVLQGCALAEMGAINSTQTGGWKECSRRAWCNNTYYNAIPNVERSWYKKMITTSAVAANKTDIQETEEWFSLPAEKELTGIQRNSVSNEFNALTHFSYYNDINNRRIKRGINGEANITFTRSQNASYDHAFCVVNKDGSNGSDRKDNPNGIAPFGCI